jgi:acyl-CoA synthetase (NDP forming)
VKLSGATLHALDAALPSNWSRSNPVDIIAHGHERR